MLHLPPRFAAVILSFAPLFFQRSWQHAEVLLIGAILAPGKRTVTSLLQISGLAQERRFVNYHRVLRPRFALLKCSCGLGKEHEVVGEDAEDEFAVLGRRGAGGQG